MSRTLGIREFGRARKKTLWRYVPYSTLSARQDYHKVQHSRVLFQTASDVKRKSFTTDERLRGRRHVR